MTEILKMILNDEKLWGSILIVVLLLGLAWFESRKKGDF